MKDLFRLIVSEILSPWAPGSVVQRHDEAEHYDSDCVEEQSCSSHGSGSRKTEMKNLDKLSPSKACSQ